MALFLFEIIGLGPVTYAHNNMVNAVRVTARRLSVAEDVVVAAIVRWPVVRRPMTHWLPPP